MKQHIYLFLSFIFLNCLTLHPVSKKSVTLRYLKESIENSYYDTDEDYSENNVPNYTSFHNAVFAIYKECEALEISYSVDASKWKNAHNIPFWRYI